MNDKKMNEDNENNYNDTTFKNPNNLFPVTSVLVQPATRHTLVCAQHFMELAVGGFLTHNAT